MVMKKDHDKLSYRLSSILGKLNNGELLTVDELAEEYDVSTKTIGRDLNDRLSTFLPIIKENGYYRLESYALGKLTYDDIKSFALLSGIKELYPELSNSFIVDLLNTKVNPAYLINHMGYEKLDYKTKEFEELSGAILNKRELSFIYNDKKRKVNPYKLINNNGIWYLAGDEKEILKTYTFSKIKNLIIKDTIFIPNKEFINTIEKQDYNWYSKNIIDVTLEITGEKIEYFLRRDILPNQKIIEQSQDKLILSTQATYEEEILGIVKHGLPNIRILSPQSLQEKLEDTLKEYLK